MPVSLTAFGSASMPAPTAVVTRLAIWGGREARQANVGEGGAGGVARDGH